MKYGIMFVLPKNFTGEYRKHYFACYLMLILLVLVSKNSFATQCGECGEKLVVENGIQVCTNKNCVFFTGNDWDSGAQSDLGATASAPQYNTVSAVSTVDLESDLQNILALHTVSNPAAAVLFAGIIESAGVEVDEKAQAELILCALKSCEEDDGILSIELREYIAKCNFRQSIETLANRFQLKTDQHQPINRHCATLIEAVGLFLKKKGGDILDFYNEQGRGQYNLIGIYQFNKVNDKIDDIFQALMDNKRVWLFLVWDGATSMLMLSPEQQSGVVDSVNILIHGHKERPVKAPIDHLEGFLIDLFAMQKFRKTTVFVLGPVEKDVLHGVQCSDGAEPAAQLD